MYLADAVRVLLRQWKIVGVGVVLVGALTVAVALYVPTQYQASGRLFLLLPAVASGEQTPTNPYLNVQSGQTLVGSLIAGSLSTKDAQKSVEEAGFESEYTIGLPPGTGPLLVITAKDTDPAEAMATRDEVMDRLRAQLTKIQREVDVPERQLITARATAVDQSAEALPGSKIRALAGLGALTAVLTLAVAFVRDGVVRRRRTDAVEPVRPRTTEGAAPPRRLPPKRVSADAEEATEISSTPPRAEPKSRPRPGSRSRRPPKPPSERDRGSIAG